MIYQPDITDIAKVKRMMFWACSKDILWALLIFGDTKTISFCHHITGTITITTMLTITNSFALRFEDRKKECSSQALEFMRGFLGFRRHIWWTPHGSLNILLPFLELPIQVICNFLDCCFWGLWSFMCVFRIWNLSEGSAYRDT